jgi:proteasome accessory factor C
MPKSSSLSGTDRYNFMLALTGYLISNRQKKISDVAKHFQVTEKEIASAVVTISLSGVGLYRPDELFFLDYDLLEEGIVDLSFAPTLEAVPRLSTRQAAAIASGLAYLVDLVDPSDQKEIGELLSILGRGAAGAQQLPFMVQPVRGDVDLGKARQAVAERRAIKCSYRNSTGEVSDREIEPLRLESREANWYLRGYCLTNKETRIFRLDRMRDIVLLDTFDERADGPGQSEEIYAVRDSDTEVLFEVDPAAFSLIADYKPDFEIRGNKSVQVRIAIGQIENLGRIVSRYSGKVRVLAPETARQVVKDFVSAALGESAPVLEAD